MSSVKTRRSFFNVLAVLALVVASFWVIACGDDDDENGDAATPEAGTRVRVVLDEMTIVPDRTTVPAGEITFEAVNEGAMPHEIVIIRTDLPEDQLPLNDDGTIVDEDQVDVIDEIEEFPAGETEEGTYELEAGRYVLICNIPGHYPAGMHVELIVE